MKLTKALIPLACLTLVLTGCSVKENTIATSTNSPEQTTTKQATTRTNTLKAQGVSIGEFTSNVIKNTGEKVIPPKEPPYPSSSTIFGTNPSTILIDPRTANTYSKEELKGAVEKVMQFMLIAPELAPLTVENRSIYQSFVTPQFIARLNGQEENWLQRIQLGPAVKGTTQKLKRDGWKQSVTGIQITSMNGANPILTYLRTWYIPDEDGGAWKLTYGGYYELANDLGAWKINDAQITTPITTGQNLTHIKEMPQGDDK